MRAWTNTPRPTASASAFSISWRSRRKMAISTRLFALLMACTRGAMPSAGCISRFLLVSHHARNYCAARVFVDAVLLVNMIKLGIETTQLQKIFVIAALHNTAVVDHENNVGAPDGGKTVGDHDGGLAFHQTIQSLEDQLLRSRVES